MYSESTNQRAALCEHATLAGKLSNEVRTWSRTPYLADLNRRRMSCSVAATRKYSCFKRSSLPSKNCHTHRQAQSHELIDCVVQDRSFPRHFIKPIFWLGVKKTKPNTTKAAFANQKKCTTTQHTHTHIHI